MDNIYNSQKSGRPQFWLFAFLLILLIAVDQFCKHIIGRQFHNAAFAFSLPVPVSLIYLIYVLVLGAMVYYLIKNYQRLPFASKLAWLIIFAGAISNIGERVMLGYVRDFIFIIFYRWTGVYNLADGYILLGIIILFINPNNNSKFQMPNIK
jgi:signal peptidase II